MCVCVCVDTTAYSDACSLRRISLHGHHIAQGNSGRRIVRTYSHICSPTVAHKTDVEQHCIMIRIGTPSNVQWSPQAMQHLVLVRRTFSGRPRSSRRVLGYSIILAITRERSSLISLFPQASVYWLLLPKYEGMEIQQASLVMNIITIIMNSACCFEQSSSTSWFIRCFIFQYQFNWINKYLTEVKVKVMHTNNSPLSNP